jgi:hypothetical protein
MANIYDARCALSRYAPLFNPVENKPGKAFYALKYFNALYRLGTAVKCEVAGGQGKDGLWALAAKGEKGIAAFVVNDSPKDRPVTVDFGSHVPVSCRLTNDEYTDEEITEIPSDPVIPPHSIVLVNFE